MASNLWPSSTTGSPGNAIFEPELRLSISEQGTFSVGHIKFEDVRN